MSVVRCNILLDESEEHLKKMRVLVTRLEDVVENHSKRKHLIGKDFNGQSEKINKYLNDTSNILNDMNLDMIDWYKKFLFKINTMERYIEENIEKVDEGEDE
jgi:C4-type Zn-finger protein